MKQEKRKVKPIAQLLIPFYFFPLVFSAFFANSYERNIAFFASTIVLCSLSCLLIYFIFKSWEAGWENECLSYQQESRNEKSQTQEISLDTSPKIEEKIEEDTLTTSFQLLEDAINQKEELLKNLYQENELIKVERLSQDDRIADLTNSLYMKEKRMKELEEIFHEQSRKSSSKDEEIAMLKSEVANLNFELRTFFKLDQK